MRRAQARRGLRPGPIVLLALAALLAACGREADRPVPRLQIAGAWFAHRNDAGFSPEAARVGLERLAALGYGWVALAPEPTMPDVTRPLIVADPNDQDTRTAIRAARAAGLEVMLCPRLESPSFFRAEKPLWRGDIAMTSAADWSAFHDALEAMLVHYATMAREERVGLFCLGLEYRQSTAAFPERWREIIAALRRVYSGPLTYSANWYEEYREVTFWDALDRIGIGAYFPIADQADATTAAMTAAWTERLEELDALARRHRRPLLFTEIGYPGLATAGERPWQWTAVADQKVDHARQADCYRAFFAARARTGVPDGLFIWRYESDPEAVRDWEYCPSGRPAEAIIRTALKR